MKINELRIIVLEASTTIIVIRMSFVIIQVGWGFYRRRNILRQRSSTQFSVI